MKPTKQAVYSSRTADKFVVRLLDEMREKIAVIARKHHRSMNSQIVNWLDICVELEESGIPVSREALAEAAKHLQEAAATPLAYGETVQVPERFYNGHPQRHIETKNEVYEIFARGNVSDFSPDGSLIKVNWIHRNSQSDWIPLSEAQKLQ